MRIAVITGASSGIGREFARQIIKCCRKLEEIWLIARSADKLEKLKEELISGRKINIRIFDGDLTREEVYGCLKESLKSERPDIRILVNCAGFGKVGRVEDIQPDSQVQMVELNCMAVTRMTCLCLPYLSKGSRIINIASAAAFAPQPGFAVYAATKSYVYSFSRALGSELKERKIIVTAVCPGPVDTAFFKIAGSIGNSRKSKLMASPEDVVKKALLDTKNKKETSIYGLPMKCARAAAGLVPDRIILKVMKRMNFKEKYALSIKR